MNELTVGLGTRSYPILIKAGLFAEIGSDLSKRKIAKRYGVIADEYVASLYADRLLDSLRSAGIQVELLTFPRGEASKNMETVARLASRLARLNFDRKDCLIALGGGVSGDITGFLAGVFMRGIPFVQVPTTLLAQVDSSVGGKTGVDIPEGKNLVGVFHQPRCVYIDISVLDTLPKEELLNGLAEVIKYGIICDRDFFGFLDRNRQAILDLVPSLLAEMIARCCTIKAEVVAADERESDLRRILNFGHTIGHALEATSDYAMAHGIAVGIGMAAAAELAAGKGILSPQAAVEIQRLIQEYGLRTDIPIEFDRRRVKAYLKTDKKAVSGIPFFVLPVEIGKVVITDEVPPDLLDRVLGIS